MLLALVSLTGVGGLVAWAIEIDHYLDPFDDQPFDQAAWAAAHSKGRGLMARDAIRQLPSGLSKAQVRELLGKPDPFPGPRGGRVDGFGNTLQHSETWAYYLGCWSSLSWYSLDDAFLYVHFDPDGKVLATEITGG